jgi:hypothetical protein
MKIGGWRTRSVFERYAILSRGDIVEAMQKLETNRRDIAQGQDIGYVAQSDNFDASCAHKATGGASFPNSTARGRHSCHECGSRFIQL